MPASWTEPSGTSIPPTCSATYAQGTYTTPTFTAPSPPCATVSSVAVTFNVAETTSFGETILLVGSIAQLGSWDTADAVELSAGDYQSGYPRWFGTVALPAGMGLLYKFIKEGSGGGVTYEVGGFLEFFLYRPSTSTRVLSFEARHTSRNPFLYNVSVMRLGIPFLKRTFEWECIQSLGCLLQPSFSPSRQDKIYLAHFFPLNRVCYKIWIPFSHWLPE